MCKVNNKNIIAYPKRVLLKYYNENDIINVELNFYSNREDMSFNYYISQPKSMLETLMIKNLDKHPEKLKILEYSRAPYYEYLILKYYASALIDRNSRLVFCVVDDWMHNSPKEPDNNFKENLRNR